MERKVALVTGGVGGIGTALTIHLVHEGYFVVANFGIPGTQGQWQDTIAAAGLADQTALAEGDVTDFASCEAMVRDIERQYGPVAGLVNCAGITRDASFRKMTPAQWDTVMRVNVYGLFNVTKQVIDGMCERGFGRIVNISSVNATQGAFGQTNYAASKAAVLGFTKSLALEVIRKGVTVNAVSPGYVDTDMTRAIREDVRQEILAKIPAARMGVPADIAHAVAFLMSEKASYITGTNLSVNGAGHLYQ
jgi:acetoacetyl-CoA reductase